MELKNFFAQDLQGNIIPNPTGYLYQPGTTTLVTGLQNAAGAPLANPFTGTAQGQLQVAAPDGDYDLRVTGAGRDYTMRVRFITDAATILVDNQAARDASIAARDAAVAARDTAAASATAAGNSATAAAATASSLATAGSINNTYASTAAALSNGVLSTTALVGGSGGTNGTFDLAFSGGGGSNAAGRFTVAGGAVTSIVITNPGTGYTSAPTLSFAASAGLTGASATAVIGARQAVGTHFSVPGTNDTYLVYRVDAGPVATFVRSLNAPYLAWQAVLGDSEMAGDADYANKVLGLYEVATQPTVFNTIDVRAWASNATTNVEWRVYIRNNNTAFNPSGVTPDASGTIAAGNFPTNNQLYRLQLPARLIAQTGQFMWVFFRATDDTNINIRRWLYNAGISPARHLFAIGTANGWNQTWGASAPTSGFGQAALKFFNESDEGRVIDGRLDPLESTVATLSQPYVAYQSVLGDGEAAGDADYGTKVLGLYETVAAASIINAIDVRVWASNAATNVEWRIYVRNSNAAFNPDSVTPNLSGTITAGNFPTSNTLYRLRLPTPVSAAAGQLVVVLFRATDNTNINIRRWLYNAGVSPARHLFFIGTSNGWNQTLGLSAPTSGFGQTALKLLRETDEGRAIDTKVNALQTQVNAITPGVIPAFTIPSTIYATVGVELNLYHDAIFSASSRGLTGLLLHTVSIIGTRGFNRGRAFQWTPTAGDVGTFAFTAKAFDAAGNLVATRNFNIVVSAATPKGAARNVLMIGDSLLVGGVATTAARDRFVALGGTTPTFIGGVGTSPNSFEGRGGTTFAFWAGSGGTAYRFTVSGVGALSIGAVYSVGGVNYTITEIDITAGAGTIRTTGAIAPPASGTLTRVSGLGDATVSFSASTTEPGNPLWNGSALDIANYRSVRGVTGLINAVTIQLGINDVFGESVRTSFTTEIANAQAICNACLADNPACKIVIELPTLCGNTADGFAANYGSTQSRRIYETNIFGLRAALLAAFDNGAFNANVSVGSVGLQVDRYYGYDLVSAAESSRITDTAMRHTNAVHPKTAGRQQMGDTYFAELMALI